MIYVCCRKEVVSKFAINIFFSKIYGKACRFWMNRLAKLRLKFSKEAKNHINFI